MLSRRQLDISVLQRLTLACVGIAVALSSGSAARGEPGWKTTLAFGSCTDLPSSPIWGSISAAKPDAFLMLGDNIYMVDPEWQSLEKIRARYRQLQNDPGFAALRKAIPLYAVWDDHDFGPNNSDAAFPFGENARIAFREMFASNPLPPPGLEKSVAFEKKIGEALVLMTDNRSYRINPEKKKAGVMFGDRQMQWIEERIQNPGAKVIVLASGNEVLPNQGGTQTLYPYTNERVRLWRAISNAPVPVVVISGDRHYGQIMVGKIGFTTMLEVSSSPLTAKPRNQISKVTFSDELQTVTSVGGQNNFGLVTISGDAAKGVLAVAELRTSDGSVAGSAKVEWPSK